MTGEENPPSQGTGIETPPAQVVLVHGLARTHRMFARMDAALTEAGFQTLRYRYASTRHNAETAVAQFHAWLDERFGQMDGQEGAQEDGGTKKPVHFVGFSLGALLIRGALTTSHAFVQGRVAMIGPPNQGAGVLNRPNHWTRWIMGPAVDDLKEGAPFIDTLGIPDTEIGVIAGTDSFFLFNPSSWWHLLEGIDEPHDGTVLVRSTHLEGMADFTTVPANHTLICQHPDTIRQTITFLKNGAFA